MPGVFLGEDVAGLEDGVEALEPGVAVGQAQSLVQRQALHMGAPHVLAARGALGGDRNGLGAAQLAQAHAGSVLEADAVAAPPQGQE